MGTIAILLLAACALIGLVLIRLGLPGLWVIVGGVLLYGWLTGFSTIGVGAIVAVLGLAFLGEVVEWWLGFRVAQRYGGSKRAGWGALIGGMVGAIVGVPVPIQSPAGQPQAVRRPRKAGTASGLRVESGGRSGPKLGGV